MDAGINQVIEKIIEAEGGSIATNDPSDGGGRTQYGISEKSNPEAWVDGKVTLEEAREIYFNKYVRGPGFDKIEDPKLLHQLVDFGVNSGPSISIKALQDALGLVQDGILGPNTLEAVRKSDLRQLNNRLVRSRCITLAKICVKNPTQLKYLVGWITRALEFML